MTKFVTAAKKFVTRFLIRREEGSVLAEYGLLLALIAVVCLGSIKNLGDKLNSMFQNLATATSANRAGGRP